MYPNKIKEAELLQAEINQFRPLKPHTFQELKEYYRIGLTYTSNALEGSSLTETETKIILEEGLTIGGKSLREHNEAVGHSEAYDHMYKLSQGKEITEEDILKLHQLFYYRIDQDRAGVYRKEQVFITGTDFIPAAPRELSFMMQEFVASIPEMRARYHPIECAARIHKDLVTIHPFVDGNGRTARLLMNLVLMQEQYCITIIPPIVRRDYIEALKKAQGEHRNDAPFVDFISSMVYENQKDYLRLLRALSTE